jgi:DnaK suppressor protein
MAAVTTYPPVTIINMIIVSWAPREAGMTVTTRSDPSDFPVRRGEQRWTQAEVSQIRQQLAGEAAELAAEIQRAESEIADRLGDAVSDAGDDQADVGAKAYEREHELALTYKARELLVQTERALARIEAGTYGSCESCGEPIGKARLQVFPRATLCVRCKQREERH